MQLLNHHTYVSYLFNNKTEQPNKNKLTFCQIMSFNHFVGQHFTYVPHIILCVQCIKPKVTSTLLL